MDYSNRDDGDTAEAATQETTNLHDWIAQAAIESFVEQRATQMVDEIKAQLPGAIGQKRGRAAAFQVYFLCGAIVFFCAYPWGLAQEIGVGLAALFATLELISEVAQ